MALIVEDGTGVTGANSYCSVAFADAFFEQAFDPAFWSSLTTEQKEAGLIMATTALDTSYTFNGRILDTEQALLWPRTPFYDSEGREQGGEGVIPTALKQATAALAYQFAKSNPLEQDSSTFSGGVKRQKIGPSEVEYFYSRQPQQFTSYINSYLVFLGTRKSSQRRLVRQ